MARPTKDPGDRAVSVTIPGWAYRLVDAHVQKHVSVAMVEIGDSEPTARELAAARSHYIAHLIDKALGFDARFQTSVHVSAPAVGGASELQEVQDWLREQETVLTNSAPAAVKAALLANREMRSLSGTETKGETA